MQNPHGYFSRWILLATRFGEALVGIYITNCCMRVIMRDIPTFVDNLMSGPKKEVRYVARKGK
jgi:hypothetical protein